MVQGDAVERQALGIGLDPDLVWPAADDEGFAHVVGLDQLVQDLLGDAVKRVVVPSFRSRGIGRESQGDDGHVVNAAADDQGLRYTGGNALDVRTNRLVHPPGGHVFVGSDLEARRHRHPIVLGQRIDVFHLVDSLDNILQGLGDQLHHVRRPEAGGLDQDVDHGNADLWFLFARQDDQRHYPQGQRQKQDKGRQRRTDKEPGEDAGKAQLHGAGSGRASTSPAKSPDSTSTPPSPVRPVCTTTSVPSSRRA